MRYQAEAGRPITFPTLQPVMLSGSCSMGTKLAYINPSTAQVNRCQKNVHPKHVDQVAITPTTTKVDWTQTVLPCTDSSSTPLPKSSRSFISCSYHTLFYLHFCFVTVNTSVSITINRTLSAAS